MSFYTRPLLHSFAAFVADTFEGDGERVARQFVARGTTIPPGTPLHARLTALTAAWWPASVPQRVELTDSACLRANDLIFFFSCVLRSAGDAASTHPPPAFLSGDARRVGRPQQRGSHVVQPPGARVPAAAVPHHARQADPVRCACAPGSASLLANSSALTRASNRPSQRRRPFVQCAIHQRGAGVHLRLGGRGARPVGAHGGAQLHF